METNTIETIGLLIKNKRSLAIVGVLAIIFSVLISSPFIMEPDYKSVFTVYPTNLSSFGKESGVEQLYQFFNSEELKKALTKRFDLFDHYQIDTNDTRAYADFNRIYNSKVNVKLTHYQSIEGSVIDVSPEFAKALAEGMIDEINNLIRKRRKEKYNEYVVLYNRQLAEKKREIDSLENKLKSMRINLGILDVPSQSKIISKKASKNNLSEADKALLNNLKVYGGEFIIIRDRFYIELENYKYLKQIHDKNLIDFNGNLTYLTVVSYPNLPDKKNSPHRTMLVLFFTFSCVLLAGLIIVARDRTRKILDATKS